MAEERNGAERTEEPTPRRRQQDVEKGEPALSQEANIAVSLLILLVFMSWWISTSASASVADFRLSLSRISMVDPGGARQAFDLDLIRESFLRVGAQVMAIVLPVSLVSTSALVAVQLVQVGPRWRLERLAPDFKRLNPASGVKRVFSTQFFLTLTKVLLKGLGVVTLAGYALRKAPYTIWTLAFLKPVHIVDFLRDLAIDVLIPVTLVLFLLATADYSWLRYRKEQQLKMTKQEVREDMKSDVGDPQIRQARRQRMKELLMGAPLPERMKEATVVATNPTHYSVALRYWAGRDEAPVVIAKGKDFRAAKIRALAQQYGIPVIEDKPLARGLFGLVKEGGRVPEGLYKAVARLLAIVYRRRGAKA